MSFLVGRTVVDIRPMSVEEMAEQPGDWSALGPAPAVICFDDGSLVWASSDGSGDHPGALFGESPTGDTVIVRAKKSKKPVGSALPRLPAAAAPTGPLPTGATPSSPSSTVPGVMGKAAEEAAAAAVEATAMAEAMTAAAAESQAAAAAAKAESQAAAHAAAAAAADRARKIADAQAAETQAIEVERARAMAIANAEFEAKVRAYGVVRFWYPQIVSG